MTCTLNRSINFHIKEADIDLDFSTIVNLLNKQSSLFHLYLDIRHLNQKLYNLLYNLLTKLLQYYQSRFIK